MSTTVDEGPANVLALVIDIPPHLVLLDGGAHHYLNSILAFANMHLAGSVNRKLCIVAATNKSTEYLYPDFKETDKNFRQKDGRLEQLLSLDECVEKKLKRLMEVSRRAQSASNGHSNGAATASGESLLSGAMGRALLFLRRHIGTNKSSKLARMLVIKVAGESMGQYLNYINVYLTAQKLGVPIDVCCINVDCGLLQQGADITGGYYHKLTDVRSLIQTLIILFSSGRGKSQNNLVSLPPSDTVDYRAACFCHRGLVNMANVCSNCLSVYCKAVPLCSTCNVFFPMDMPMKRQNKKKR